MIVESIATLVENPALPHGPIRLCFTCDEEIGHGVDHVDRLMGNHEIMMLLTAIGGARAPWTAFALICLAWLIVSLYTSINAVVKAELFPAAIRVTGVALPYAVTVSVFGGSAEYVALWLKSQGHESWFYWYATGCISISLIVYCLIRDMKKHSRMEQHV